MRKIKVISLLFVLLFGINVRIIQADSLGYDPITIYTKNCSIEEEQTVFFDVLIQVEDNRLLSVMNDTYLNEYPNGEDFSYHSIEDYDSYLAYYPGAEFASINCYMSAYTFLESEIKSFKLVAFDVFGEVITVSDTQDINTIGYDTGLNLVKYYEFDYTTLEFRIVQDEVDPSLFGQTIDFVGSFIVSLVVYFILGFVGILPFMINSKKLHKESYIETLLVGNSLIFMGLLFLLNLEINGVLVFSLIALVYVVSMLFIFNRLNKRYNPTYKLFDILYILLAYAGMVGLTILILS